MKKSAANINAQEYHSYERKLKQQRFLSDYLKRQHFQNATVV